MFNGLNSFTLLAVPLFILAANLMNEGAISDRLIDVCSASVGHVRGGLAHANILVSMILQAYPVPHRQIRLVWEKS